MKKSENYDKKFNVLILAAGESSRFKSNKLTFILNDKPLILNVFNLYNNLKFINKIIVVTGYPKYQNDIKQYFPKQDNIHFVNNKLYKQGMFTSIKAGIKNSTNENLILHPGDIPLVKQKTILKIIDFYYKNADTNTILIPSYNYKSGHPIILSKTHLPKILKMKNDDNLRNYLKLNSEFKIYCNTTDKFILKDIDKKEQIE